MDKDSFELGEPYFFLSYFDDDLKYPDIVSLIFIGKNIEPNDYDKDTWSFQSAESFVDYGQYPSLNNSATVDTEIEVFDYHENCLRDILTLDKLIQKLTNAKLNRSEPFK